MFTAHTVQKEESESSGRTYWLPAGASPACALEQIVQEILHWHQDRLGIPDASGAEWWTLWMDGEEDDVGWHWDADYEARDRGEVKHPFLGTVTYLEDGGSSAPTAIIEDCREQPIMAGNGAVIRCAHLSLPIPGKHICFDGTLLHGAPVELREVFGCRPPNRGKKKSSRSTLLVNIWCSHRPPDCQRLPADTAAKLGPVTVASAFTLGSQRAASYDVVVGRGVPATEMSWSFGESDSLSVTFPVPAKSVEALKDADTISVHFTDGRCGCVG